MNKLNVVIRNIEKKIYDGQADIVIMKTIDGDIGIMAHHIAVVTVLDGKCKKCNIKIKSGGHEMDFKIENGVAKVESNELLILDIK